MDLSQGGHLTHGSPVNFSGLLYKAVSYGLDDSGYIDMGAVRRQARELKPKMIIAGYSAYPRVIDFAAFAEIAKEVGAIFMVDMAHFAGLAATGVYPSPVPHADVVTTTTHKTLRGPRGGLILCKTEHAAAVNKAMFPGTQGGPLEHVIAAKAVALKEALEPSFKVYSKQIVANAQALAKALVARGYQLVSGGTDNHLMLVDLRNSELDGQQAEDALHRIGITVNRNAVPFDPRPPMVSSGLRIGTPALAPRGFDAAAFEEVADIIAAALAGSGDVDDQATLRGRVEALAQKFPLYSSQEI
jgi:glycine hydroxymethyltransferase